MRTLSFGIVSDSRKWTTTQHEATFEVGANQPVLQSITDELVPWYLSQKLHTTGSFPGGALSVR